jgi:Ca2+-binding EF-hand superfamily protein
MRTAFDMFDKDGSGKIDKAELIAILCSPETGEVVPKN